MVLRIVAGALHMLNKCSFMALCSVLITSQLGVVASQPATCAADVREGTDIAEQVTASSTFSVPEPGCLTLQGMRVCWVQQSFRICASWL